MKSKLQRLRAEVDKLWREAIIKEYGDRCEVCGRPADHCHHFFPKGLYSALRLEIKNGVPLCFHCHFSRHHKGDPKINETIIKKRGKKWISALTKQAYYTDVYGTGTIGYYQKKIEELKI